MWAWCQKYAEIFKDYICDAGDYLDKADREGKKILFEAQLGALRDIDFGIYPYTSSSNVIGAYAPIGAGIPGHKLDLSIGIMKAYSSCVGDGPFTAELAMTEEEKDKLREAGHEYGAATGRPRRVGPIDVVASRTHRDVGNAAANLLFKIVHIVLSLCGQLFKLAAGGNIAVPAGQILDHGFCIVQCLAHGEAISQSAVSQLIVCHNGDLFHVIQHIQQGEGYFVAALAANTVAFIPTPAPPM